MNDIQESIADDMSRVRRVKAVEAMVGNMTTDDLELVNERFPKLVDAALHEILNENWQVLEAAGVNTAALQACMAAYKQHLAEL